MKNTEVQNPSRSGGVNPSKGRGKSEIGGAPSGPASGSRGTFTGSAKPHQTAPLSILSQNNIRFITGHLPPAERLRRFHEAVARLKEPFADAAWHYIRGRSEGCDDAAMKDTLQWFLQVAFDAFFEEFGEKVSEKD